MNSPWPILLLFALIVVTTVVLGSVAEKRRRKELAAFAGSAGFAFTPGEVHGHAERLAGFTPFGVGRSRRASNLIEGERGGARWEMFDYRYTTGSGKNRRVNRFGVVVARVDFAFPRATLRPEGVFDSIASLAGFGDIEFQSETFSRRYHVTGEDRRRIYDLVHPGMTDYLLSLPAVHWQLGPGVVLMTRRGRYAADELRRATEMIEGFLARVPGYVRADRAGVPGGAARQ